MKIIDKSTGKRFDSKEIDEKTFKKKIKENDPILRNAEKEEGDEEFSAMDPPDAYDSSKTVGLDYETLHPFIQELVNEHKEVKEKVKIFDECLSKFRESNYSFTREIADEMNLFYVYFDEHILPHNRKEERDYFRILHTRFIESGEHGEGDNPQTAIDLMEDDHVKFIQLGALSFNLFGLATRLRDTESQMLTFDLAYNTARELVELIRLHIFREDETLFPLSQKLLTKEDFLYIHGQ
ncbi:MAG: hemerythrin domain-containing protein [Flavobacteriia bacterium]|nr:hemerythrin domain-containing protein [Flavobacteriia bacterium]